MMPDSSGTSPRSSAEPLVTDGGHDALLQMEEWGDTRNTVDPSEDAQDHLSAFIWRLWTAVASKIPGLTQGLRCVADWIHGPGSPVTAPGLSPWLSIRWRSNKQRVPLETIFARRTRFLSSSALFITLIAVYILVISALSRAQSYSVPSDQLLDCTSTFWPAPYDRCGRDGENCAPHSNASFSFRCPPECSTVYLHNPRVIGAKEVVYEPLIVGGGDEQSTYRGDSWICAAALHAAIISDRWGGCVDVDLIGSFTNFLPRASQGLASIGFPSDFPLSFRLSPNTSLSHCIDLRTPALVFNAIVTFLLFAVLRPKPIILYWSLVCIGFWHVTLFSQPRSAPPDLEFGFATFLPALFVCYAFWECAVKWVLPELVECIPLEGAVLYLGPWWITVLNNQTLDRLPVDRLMMGDIMKRAGGLVTLIAGAIVVTAILLNQIMIMRRTGCLARYLQWYGMGLGVVIALAAVPTLNLRIHHYIFAIMFIPGTAFPTRLSAVFQGFLLGMFLNGVAAWGFDGILQTTEGLRRDAPTGSIPPSFLPFDPANEVIRWAALPEAEGWDGFRLLVNDVERYAGAALNYSTKLLRQDVPHFFRIAFTKAGERAGDWTMPGTLWPNGTWEGPLPGSSY